MRSSLFRKLIMTSLIVMLVMWYQLDSNIKRKLQENETEPQVSAINRTCSEARVLVYNRVPKSGSTSMVFLLKRLAEVNNFTHFSSIIYSRRRISEEEEWTFVKDQERKMLNYPEQTFSVDRHVYFINFTKYNAARPIYINMFRDPVLAFASTFYYLRSPNRWKEILNFEQEPSEHERYLKLQREVYPRNDTDPNSRKLVMPNENWLHQSLEDCVLNEDFECNLQPGTGRESFVAFLCGSEDYCRYMKNKDALQEAKLNLETAYSVVGILEHLNASLQVMEAYIPRYFTGARDVFSKLGSFGHANKNPHSTPSPEVRAKLTDTFSHDVELYEFARQRLFLQLAAVMQP